MVLLRTIPARRLFHLRPAGRVGGSAYWHGHQLKCRNQWKHGVFLADPGRMDFDTAIYAPDDRYDYGEDRIQALGSIGGRLHMLAFTMRGDTLRAISLQKANAREARLYDEEA